MFRVKICGVTTIRDALAAIDAGADAIGLNFYAGSPRCVTPDFARRATAAIAGRAVSVGVFVNESPEEMRRIAAHAGLSAIQLHGDEPLSAVAGLRPLRVVLARRLAAADVQPFAAELAKLRPADLPDALLVDAAAPGRYGGSGQTADWDSLQGHAKWLQGAPLVLAGGLKPENVAQAIRAVRPAGVDTASGVESSPGVKDAAKLRDFVAAALRAFAG